MSARVAVDAAAARPRRLAAAARSLPTRSRRCGRWRPARRITSWPAATMPARPGDHRLCRAKASPATARCRRWPSICATASTTISPTTPRRRRSPRAPRDAFKLKRGVCQDFSHVMIAGLRGLGVPAGYVSGFLRTIPPPGKERLEGADAMHAWVRVWCGREAGWLEFDPTNAMRAGDDHITRRLRPRLFRRRADRRHRQDRRRPGGGTIGGRDTAGRLSRAGLSRAGRSRHSQIGSEPERPRICASIGPVSTPSL